MLLLATIAALAALMPALLFLRNLCLFKRLPAVDPRSLAPHPRLSVLIPARNEERSIAAAIESLLASDYPNVEVLVLDDHSNDRTAAIVESFGDRRVTLHRAPPLPAGWNGKQHACHILSTLATGELLLFLDADVRLEPAALRRLVAALQPSPAALLSGFPRQITRTPLEMLLIPLMHFVLLGFLPLARMRNSAHPAYAAGCGQLFIARAAAYRRSGGHAAIRASLHDGVTLPRAFRRHGLLTDIFDATDLAHCRMYRSAPEVWNGLSKNACEGLAAPRLILPATLLLFAGQVLPFLLLVAAWFRAIPRPALLLAIAAAALALLPRLLAARRFRQPPLAALLHPLAIALFLLLQWTAILRTSIGAAPAWKGRRSTKSPPTDAPASLAPRA